MFRSAMLTHSHIVEVDIVVHARGRAAPRYDRHRGLLQAMFASSIPEIIELVGSGSNRVTRRAPDWPRLPAHYTKACSVPSDVLRHLLTHTPRGAPRGRGRLCALLRRSAPQSRAPAAEACAAPSARSTGLYSRIRCRFLLSCIIS
ncbi:hypothetical protein EVAR_20470_1 [Eumeta japonica]|uniref:Uncharacterized protein n=1 Tax=Eumeta variegata TaxID=151549 RepID=A0A4C1TYE2_EUMVA|nr:hypothetical protein EVAR_20470_1 [Eumeta japonica]